MSSPVAPVYLRPMTKGDLDRVLEIAADVPTAPNWPRSIWSETINPCASLPRIVLVAVPNPIIPSIEHTMPTVLGFAVASLFPPHAELETIAVAQAQQRKGVGRRLLSGLIEQLSHAGIGELLLEVRASNQAAISLYRSFGFRETGIRAGYYRDPKDDAIQMQLHIQ